MGTVGLLHQHHPGAGRVVETVGGEPREGPVDLHAAAHERGQPLEAWTYHVEELRAHECRLQVLSCGLCYSDIHMIDNDWQISRYPLVPGHEVGERGHRCGAAANEARCTSLDQDRQRHEHQGCYEQWPA